MRILNNSPHLNSVEQTMNINKIHLNTNEI